ncbi:MAG: SO_0444 family Cu/Zn efflux transporter [Planctomycetes bacterium]|nr:SO_0444 family Cu/Zn efflux transporter [Planctomycetota bacterium]
MDLLGPVVDVMAASWGVFRSFAPWLLGGCLVAGVIHVLVPAHRVQRAIGGRGLGATVRAALLGIPLPLCSCSVVPTALALRRRGAGKGATLSFLVSTPETGVDSIAMTWALMGPAMAVVRPVAAFLTAIAAGLLGEWTDRDGGDASAPSGGGCAVCEDPDHEAGEVHGRRERVARVFSYAYGDLLEDFAPWLLLGCLLAGFIVVVHAGVGFGPLVGRPWLEMVAMLVVSVPLYVCATASTPVAAAFHAAGFSPGAVLVLLLAGPATNAATVVMVAGNLGRRSAVAYLASIVGVSLALGALLNWGTGHLEALTGEPLIQVTAPLSGGRHEESASSPATLAAVVLAALMLRPRARRTADGGGTREAPGGTGASHGVAEGSPVREGPGMHVHPGRM